MMLLESLVIDLIQCSYNRSLILRIDYKKKHLNKKLIMYLIPIITKMMLIQIVNYETIQLHCLIFMAYEYTRTIKLLDFVKF